MGVKKDAKVDKKKGVKVEANMGIKGGATRVDVQTRCKIMCPFYLDFEVDELVAGHLGDLLTTTKPCD